MIYSGIYTENRYEYQYFKAFSKQIFFNFAYCELLPYIL